MKTPQLYIVNNIDRPCEERLARKAPNGKFYYVFPKIRSSPEYWGMRSIRATPVEHFGIEIEYVDGNIRGKLVRDSVATYVDGRPRKWQGESEFEFDYNQK